MFFSRQSKKQLARELAYLRRDLETLKSDLRMSDLRQPDGFGAYIPAAQTSPVHKPWSSRNA